MNLMSPYNKDDFRIHRYHHYHAITTTQSLPRNFRVFDVPVLPNLPLQVAWDYFVALLGVLCTVSGTYASIRSLMAKLASSAATGVVA